MPDLSEHEPTRFDSDQRRRAENIPGHGQRMLEQVKLLARSSPPPKVTAAQQRAQAFGSILRSG